MLSPKYWGKCKHLTPFLWYIVTTITDAVWLKRVGHICEITYNTPADLDKVSSLHTPRWWKEVEGCILEQLRSHVPKTIFLHPSIASFLRDASCLLPLTGIFMWLGRCKVIDKLTYMCKSNWPTVSFPIQSSTSDRFPLKIDLCVYS